MGLEVRAQQGLVEMLELEREVVDVAAGLAGRRPSVASERGVDRDEVDERRAGAKLHEAECVDPALLRAAEDVAVEAQRALA